MKKILSVTHGKIILIGEHSVVYNKPAIAIPFLATDLKVYIEKSEENKLECSFYNGRLEDSSEDLQGLKSMIEEFINRYNIKDKFKVIIESSIPNERGMGSSAASSIGVSRALFKYFNIYHDIEDIKSLANISEKIIHGNPSGIDINVVASENSVYFQKGKEIELFPINMDGYLVIADTGKKGRTKEAVSDVKKLLDSNNKEVFSAIEEMGILAEKSKELILKNDIKSLGDIFNKFQENLRIIGVSDSTLEHLIEIANNNGALGSKLTGGGRGGCMIALADSVISAETIAKKLKEKSESVWIFSLSKRENI